MKKPKTIRVTGNKITCGKPSIGENYMYWVRFEYPKDYDSFSFLVSSKDAERLSDWFDQLSKRLAEIEGMETNEK